MRVRPSILTVVLAAGLLVGGANLLWAQPPGIDIELSFDNPSLYFALGEPIALEAEVSNQTGADIWISEGFSTKVFYRQLRIIDPSGRLLLAKLNAPSPAPPDAEPTADQFAIEAPDAPAYPWKRVGDTVVRGGFCEQLPAGWKSEPWQQRAEDIRDYYDISLPGYYSAQVQVAAKVFNGAACGLKDYQWEGLVKSETVYFYVEGATRIKVIPEKWRLKWQNDRKKPKRIKVQIWPETGMTVEDYLIAGIKLNNLAPLRIKKTPSKIEAYFDGNLAIETIGDVELNHWYTVELSGQLTSGEFFGGAQKIKIVK
jgi:hypothetical protein